MDIVSVVAAIIIENNRILIAKRKGGDFDGMYEFPGGKIEVGEKSEEALKREIVEELDVKINLDGFFMTAEYDYPNFHLQMDCYLCSLIDKNIKLVDHSSYRWITSDEEDIEWIPADIQIIEKLRNEGY